MVRFYEKMFEKTAMAMAVDLPPDGKRWGTIFMGMTEVMVVGTPILLAPEVAEEW